MDEGVVMNRRWAWSIAPCPLCKAAVSEPCKNTKNDKSYRGLYTHRARVSGAVSLALMVECPKCGRPPAVPCFITVGGQSRDKVHEERIGGVRKRRKEQQRVSAKREAEAAVAAMKKIDWNAVEGGGQWGVYGDSTVLTPPDGGAVYVIDQRSGRLFRSVTKGSYRLTSCHPQDAVHHQWIFALAPKVPGGDQLTTRAAVSSSTLSSTLTVTAVAEAPQQPPEPKEAPVSTPPVPTNSSGTFLNPVTRKRQVIIEEVNSRLELTRRDLARMIAVCGGVRVRSSKLAVKLEGPDDDPVVVVEWSKTTETEKTDA